jgi:hypothetical protein
METVIVKIVKVALKLRKLSVATMLKNVESILEKMTDNDNFVTPNPPLATIETQKEELRTANATATGGSRADRAMVKGKRRALYLSLKTLAYYVEALANTTASTAENVVKSSGMDLKKFTPRPKRVFTVVNTKESGVIKTWCPRAKKDVMFDFEYTRTPADIASYIPTGPLPAATRIIPKLISGQKYYFRWSAFTKDGRKDWSDFMGIVVK